MTRKCLIPLLLLSSMALSQGRDLSVITAQPEGDATYSLTNIYQNRYWTEGRDNLDGDDIWVTSFNYTWESLTAGLLYGKSTETTYEELQLGLTWNYDISEDLQFYAGYAYIDYMDDNVTDNELGFGFVYTGCPWDIEYGLDIYYSSDAGGTFAEISATREWELTEKWSTSATGILGMNQGYNSDGSDGLNHMAAIIGLSCDITECLTFGLDGIYSWGLDRTDSGDVLTDDQLLGRASLVWSF